MEVVRIVAAEGRTFSGLLWRSGARLQWITAMKKTDKVEPNAGQQHPLCLPGGICWGREHALLPALHFHSIHTNWCAGFWVCVWHQCYDEQSLPHTTHHPPTFIHNPFTYKIVHFRILFRNTWASSPAGSAATWKPQFLREKGQRIKKKVQFLNAATYEWPRSTVRSFMSSLTGRPDGKKQFLFLDYTLYYNSHQHSISWRDWSEIW